MITPIQAEQQRSLLTHNHLTAARNVAAVTQMGRTVLLEQASGRYFGLSDVGTRIWELIQQRAAPMEIVDRLQEEYEVTRDRLMADTAALLDELWRAELIKWE